VAVGTHGPESKMKRQIQRFAIAGVVGFTVDASVLFLALLGGLGYLAGRLVSFLAAAYVTWQINRRFAFRGSRKEKSHGQWWRYLAVMALGAGLNFAVYCAVVHVLGHSTVFILLAAAAGSGAAMVMNFSAAKWWVFK
jgi:putative flippase GtrA